MQCENFEYELIEEGVRITQYTGFDEMLAIPSQIDGRPVVEIGTDAFADNGMLLWSISVPPSVKRIREGAFRTCVALQELRLSEGLEWIEMEALYLTPIEYLVLPNTLKGIECPWELSGMHFFMDDKHPCFYSDGKALYQRKGDERILLVLSNLDELESYQAMEGTTIIGESAFAGNKFLAEIILPDTVHTIGNSAMESCESLRQIILPEGLRKIGEYAFSRCIGLEHIHLPASLEEIGDHGISDTYGWSESLNGITSVTVEPENPYFTVEDEVLLYRRGDTVSIVKYFGHHHRYDIPDGVTEVCMSAFRRSDCYEISIPGSVRRVEKDAFKECKLLEWIYLEETDTRLYVPRNPIYRKDEIVGLLDIDEENRPMPISPDELPEKWKKFGYVNISGNKEHECPRDTSNLFDYVGYDRLFPTYLNTADHIGMLCCRLMYPVNLSPHVEANYREYVNAHWMEMLEDMAAREDMEHLSDLAILGFFTSDNIEESMDVFNRSGRTKMLGFLMNYKNENLADEEFDFSL